MRREFWPRATRWSVPPLAGRACRGRPSRRWFTAPCRSSRRAAAAPSSSSTSDRGSSCRAATGRRSPKRCCAFTATAGCAPSSVATRAEESRASSPWRSRPRERSGCTASLPAVLQALERREVAQRRALVAALLEQPGEIEMRLRHRRLALERPAILAHRLVDRALVLENDAEIEMRDAVPGLEVDRLTVQRFGLGERLSRMPHPAEVDPRVDMALVDAERIPVRRLGIERRADALERDAELEPVIGRFREPRRERLRAALGERDALGAGIDGEVEQRLPGFGIPRRVARGDEHVAAFDPHLDRRQRPSAELPA